MITGKLWIAFERNMNIKFEKPLLISSYTAIDGRGVDVGIQGFGCLSVFKVEYGFSRDKNMKVTVAFNRFGLNCNQRMPRIRHGYAHLANNLYQGWEQYAIGGSMSPSIKSESNYFVDPKSGKEEVTWRNGIGGKSKPWNFYFVGDLFTNGALFFQTGIVANLQGWRCQICEGINKLCRCLEVLQNI